MTARQQGRQLNAAFSLRPRSVCAMRAIWMIVLRPCLCAQHSPASLCLSVQVSVCVRVDYSYFKLFAIYCVHFRRCNFDWCAPGSGNCNRLFRFGSRKPAESCCCCLKEMPDKSLGSLIELSCSLCNSKEHSLSLSSTPSLSLSLSTEIAFNLQQHCELKTFATKSQLFEYKHWFFLILHMPRSFFLSLLLSVYLSLCIASLTDNGNNKEVFCCVQTKFSTVLFTHEYLRFV